MSGFAWLLGFGAAAPTAVPMGGFVTASAVLVAAAELTLAEMATQLQTQLPPYGTHPFRADPPTRRPAADPPSGRWRIQYGFAQIWCHPFVKISSDLPAPKAPEVPAVDESQS